MKSLRLEIQLAPIMQLYIVASTEEKGKMSGENEFIAYRCFKSRCYGLKSAKKIILWVSVESLLTFLLSGLCGNYNDVQKDDFKTGSDIIEGTPTSFVNFWKQNCPDIEITFDNPCSLNIETGA